LNLEYYYRIKFVDSEKHHEYLLFFNSIEDRLKKEMKENTYKVFLNKLRSLNNVFYLDKVFEDYLLNPHKNSNFINKLKMILEEL